MLDVWARAAVIMQIESRLGADNAADIAAVEGGELQFLSSSGGGGEGTS